MQWAVIAAATPRKANQEEGSRKQEARQLAKGQWEEDWMKLVVVSGCRTRILI